MAGMSMGSGASLPASAISVDGIKPVPTQVLASADWQGMKITAQAMTAVPFVIYNGTSEQMVKPRAQRELSPDGDAQRRPDRRGDPLRDRVGDDQPRPARSSTTSASGR